MASIPSYFRQLQKLQKSLSVDLRAKALNEGFEIGGVFFKPIQRSQLYDETLLKRGVLIRDLNSDEIRYCETNRVSYFTSSGKLGLFKNNYHLKIELPKKPSQHIERSSPKPDESSPQALLLSPNVFKMLDVLFRLSDQDLKRHTSALSLARQFALNQPKISKFMRALRVHTIYDLRKAIAELPDSWWRHALLDQRTHRGLTPFFVKAKPHYSLLKLTPQEVTQRLKEWEASHAQIVPGPLEIAKNLGFLRDQDITLWGTKEALHLLKAQFKLIPGMDKQKTVWQLATPDRGESAEALVTQIQFDSNHEAKSRFSRANAFRTIWDLGFGSERLKELQISVLRKVIGEV